PAIGEPGRPRDEAGDLQFPGGPSRRRDPEDAPAANVVAAAEKDLVRRVPRAARVGRRGPRDELTRSSGDPYSFQLTGNEKRDVPTIRGPEGIRGPFGVRNDRGSTLCQQTLPEVTLAIGRPRRVDEDRGVWRQSEPVGKRGNRLRRRRNIDD